MAGFRDVIVKVCVARQRIAELEQRLENVSEEKEKLLEQMERRDMQVPAWLFSSAPKLSSYDFLYRPCSRGDNTFGSTRVRVCWPWPWLAWGCRSRSWVRDQGQTVKIVYALPFEPVVQNRSILGLGLPSSANRNCKWPLPVHYNCLFKSVIRGRSTCCA